MKRKVITLFLIIITFWLIFVTPTFAKTEYPTWELKNGKWYYMISSTNFYKNGYYKINNKYYIFDKNGVMRANGWYCLKGTGYEDWYYLNADGSEVTGWKKINGLWYYFDLSNARMVKNNTILSNGKHYALGSDGAMVTNGWMKKIWMYDADTGKESYSWYYAGKDGVCATGWRLINNKWYYFSDYGRMYSNTIAYTSEGTYAIATSGELFKNCWVKLYRTSYDSDNNPYQKAIWYYADDDGQVYKGWHKIKGIWYYFDKTSGEMCDTNVKDNEKLYFFNSDGAMLSNQWHKEAETKWFYLDGSGAAVSGWKLIGGEWYYFEKNYFEMVSNTEMTIDGKTYQFAADGHLIQ